MNKNEPTPCCQSHHILVTDDIARCTTCGKLYDVTYADDEKEQFETILEEARSVTDGGRNYGSPEDNFSRIAKCWTEILQEQLLGGLPIPPRKVALMMITMKACREAHSPKRDNWVDMAGYARCGSEITVPEPEAVDNDMTAKSPPTKNGYTLDPLSDQPHAKLYRSDCHNAPIVFSKYHGSIAGIECCQCGSACSWVPASNPHNSEQSCHQASLLSPNPQVPFSFENDNRAGLRLYHGLLDLLVQFQRECQESSQTDKQGTCNS